MRWGAVLIERLEQVVSLQAFASEEFDAYAIAQDFDVDYVFVRQCTGMTIISEAQGSLRKNSLH